MTAVLLNDLNIDDLMKISKTLNSNNNPYKIETTMKMVFKKELAALEEKIADLNAVVSSISLVFSHIVMQDFMKETGSMNIDAFSEEVQSILEKKVKAVSGVSMDVVADLFSNMATK